MLISFEFLDLLKVVCNGKSSFLASADDSGDVKVHSIVVLILTDYINMNFCGTFLGLISLLEHRSSTLVKNAFIKPLELVTQVYPCSLASM